MYSSESRLLVIERCDGRVRKDLEKCNPYKYKYQVYRTNIGSDNSDRCIIHRHGRRWNVIWIFRKYTSPDILNLMAIRSCYGSIRGCIVATLLDARRSTLEKSTSRLSTWQHVLVLFFFLFFLFFLSRICDPKLRRFVQSCSIPSACNENVSRLSYISDKLQRLILFLSS